MRRQVAVRDSNALAVMPSSRVSSVVRAQCRGQVRDGPAIPGACRPSAWRRGWPRSRGGGCSSLPGDPRNRSKSLMPGGAGRRQCRSPYRRAGEDVGVVARKAPKTSGPLAPGTGIAFGPHAEPRPCAGLVIHAMPGLEITDTGENNDLRQPPSAADTRRLEATEGGHRRLLRGLIAAVTSAACRRCAASTRWT